MSKSLQQIIGYVPLTGVIQAVKSGIPDNLPEAFYKKTKEVKGTAGRYTQITGTRKTARLVNYGAAAYNRAQRNIATKDVKLIHTFEEIKMNPLILQVLRGYDSYEMQQNGIQEIDRQMAEFRRLFDNLRLAQVYSVLALNNVYFDGDGNLLPSSSGAKTTVSFDWSANNQNQLNSIITASWANANTDIPLQLRNLKTRAQQTTGYPLKYAFYGANIPTYLTNNNYVVDYLSRNVSFASKFVEQNEIPQGLFGLEWWPVYTSFYEDADGTNQTFFGADTVVFTPDIGPDVWEFMEGSFGVPTTFNPVSDMMAAMNSLKWVYGMFGYGLPQGNPPSISLFGGDTFLAVPTVVDAFYTADVTP